MPNFDRMIPILTYQDIPAAHDFLVRAFSFSGGWGVFRNAECQPIHGEVRAGDATIWLHRVTAEHGLNSPLASDVANSGLFVYVDDVDAHYEPARAAGALIDSQPSISPLGSASTARGILKNTDGGLPLRGLSGRADHYAQVISAV